MIKKSSSIHRFIKVSLSSFILFSLSAFSAYSQEMPKMNTDSASNKTKQMSDDEEIAHSFFTHMGMPEAVGVFSLRLAALATRMDDTQMNGTTQMGGKTKADFAFHFETGLSKFVGLHIRNDRFLDNTHTEIMFQFAVIRSKDGMSGFSPVIEFEIPTKKGASGINTMVGFSTAFVKFRFAFNQVIHYNPQKDMVDGSAALVYKVNKRIFLVVEILGEKMPHESAIINLLGGIKVKLNNNFILGIAYQQPTTTNKDFSSQYIFQPDIELKR